MVAFSPAADRWRAAGPESIVVPLGSVLGREVRVVNTRKLPKQLWYTDLMRTLVDFWRVYGVDRTPRGRQLFQFCRTRHGSRVNTYNVGLILQRLVNVGVVVRESMMNRAVEYRFRRAYAFPTWPGYAREVEEFLPGGFPHVWVDGTASFLGRDLRGTIREVPITSADHFYSEYTSYRASLHAVFRGLDPRSGDHLQLIHKAIDETPVRALRSVFRNATRDGATPALGRVLDQSRYCRALADATHPSQPDWLADDWARHADAATELLHAVSGHDHLVRPAFRGALVEGITPRLVFLELGAALCISIDRLMRGLPGTEHATALERAARRGWSTPASIDEWSRTSDFPIVRTLWGNAPRFTALFARTRHQSTPVLPSFDHNSPWSSLTPARIGEPVMA